ncbi:hypothetical protein POP12_007 [Pectobacterium phage POP12]|nr:hypothetical protein POP12_007 [Pectobacterium phage POP12]
MIIATEKEKIKNTLTILNLLKSDKRFLSRNAGICYNLDRKSHDIYKTSETTLRASVILKRMGYNHEYPVEKIYLKLIGKPYRFELCGASYLMQRDKWDIKNNPYAKIRYALLDKMIAFLEEKL